MESIPKQNVDLNVLYTKNVYFKSEYKHGEQ